MTTDYIPCCQRCPGKKCPEFIWRHLPVEPFEIRDQLAPMNTRIRPHVVFVEYSGITESFGPVNSPLTITYEVGLWVSELGARGIDVRDIEVWMMPCL